MKLLLATAGYIPQRWSPDSEDGSYVSALFFPLPPSAVRVLFPGTACREDAVGFALFSVAETMSAIRFTALYSIPFYPSWISITAPQTRVRTEPPASTWPQTTTATAPKTMRARTALTSKTTVAPPHVKVCLLPTVTTSFSLCLFPEHFCKVICVACCSKMLNKARSSPFAWNTLPKVFPWGQYLYLSFIHWSFLAKVSSFFLSGAPLMNAPLYLLSKAFPMILPLLWVPWKSGKRLIALCVFLVMTWWATSSLSPSMNVRIF